MSAMYLMNPDSAARFWSAPVLWRFDSDGRNGLAGDASAKIPSARGLSSLPESSSAEHPLLKPRRGGLFIGDSSPSPPSFCFSGKDERGLAHFKTWRHVVAVCLFWSATQTTTAATITNVAAVNVTPTTFSILWRTVN